MSGGAGARNDGWAKKGATMSEVELLLSDEFVEFSQKIAKIHEEKKAKKAELKALYDKMKAEIETLDDNANTLKVKFDSWKDSKTEAD